jgi:hypothetical protein
LPTMPVYGSPRSAALERPVSSSVPIAPTAAPTPPAQPIQRAIPTVGPAALLFYAESLDDLERTRIAIDNRRRALGVNAGGVDVRLEFFSEQLAEMERLAVRDLERAMREHPLGPWVKRTVGVGAKQAARLLAAMGDPLWNGAADRPRRGPAELWAYCGFRPGQGKRKGQDPRFNHRAKMRAFLVAESCIKHRHSPYRAVYDRERAKWAEREVSDGHKHAHALRVVAKEILKDIWNEAVEVRTASGLPTG